MIRIHRSQSLQTQLLLSLVIGILAIFSVFWWLSQTALHNLSEEYVVTRLDHDTELIREHLLFDKGQWQLRHSDVGPIYLSPNGGHYYHIQTPQGGISSPSLQGQSMETPPLKPAQIHVYEVPGPVEDVLLVRGQQMQVNGQPVSIYVAENHDPVRQVLLRFDALFALLTLLAMASIYVMQSQTLRRVFQRLKPLEDNLQAFQLGRKVEFDASQYPLEVRSLIESLNLALDNSRLQFELARQRNSDLSHALKTPLNLIFQHLQATELEAYPELKQSLANEAKKILHKIEYELKTERFAQTQVVTDLPLAPIVSDLVETMAQLHRDKQLNYQVDVIEGARVHLEQEDAFELLGNLMDNASKWAKTQVVVRFDGQRLVVEDDGVGVSDADLQRLEQRGFRGDETTPGHGIGLSIVKRLIQVYQGNLSFSHSSLGGLKVEVVFEKISAS